MKFLNLLCIVFLFCACQNNSSGNAGSNDAAGVVKPGVAVKDVDWKLTDSVEYIYYPNPLKQKEYKTRFVKDKQFLKSLVANLEEPLKENKVCTHNSKFFLFHKGDVFKTVYVSDSCNYLAYAINSQQNFIGLKADVKRMIDSLRNVTLKD